jgi:ribosomal protein S18 acetylase RimI-like enzyme
MLPIESVEGDAFDGFFLYLNAMLKDNGNEGIYFQPLSKGESHFPSEKEKSFRDGADVVIGSPGWRRTWVMRNNDGQIAGHIDLRSHSESSAEHRCVLGMGVNRAFRKRGVGLALIAHVEQWAANNTNFRWIDLQVLTSNKPAVALYERAQFIKTGEIPEMFVLDGKPFSYTFMAKRIYPPA